MARLPLTRLDAVAGDETIADCFSDEAELSAMLAFEGALAAAQAEVGLIPAASSEAIAAACRRFQPDHEKLNVGMLRDGLVVPALIAQLRASLPETHRPFLHFGSTSQDVIDSALTLRLKTVVEELDRRMLTLIEKLETLRAAEGAIRLMAQTRMQRALPSTVGERITTWLLPLIRHRARLAELSPRLLVIQMGGPIGVRGDKGDAVAAALAQRLGLGNASAWHTARDPVAEFASWLSLVTGALGKIGQDVALLAQNEVGVAKLAGGGTSSAMPHKNNPVVAEILVALARFNAGQLGTLHQALVHENERSGAAWTLEWMLLPQMAITAGASLRHANALVIALHFADTLGSA